MTVERSSGRWTTALVSVLTPGGSSDEFGFTLLSMTAEHAEAVRRFPEPTRPDPFDRLLVARASCAGSRLLTADRVPLTLGRDVIMDASA